MDADPNSNLDSDGRPYNNKPMVGYCKACQRAFLLCEPIVCPFCLSDAQVGLVPVAGPEEQVKHLFVYLVAVTQGLAYFVGQDISTHLTIPAWVREEIQKKRRAKPGPRLLDEIWRTAPEHGL